MAGEGIPYSNKERVRRVVGAKLLNLLISGFYTHYAWKLPCEKSSMTRACR
jgi:hypothetical protein